VRCHLLYSGIVYLLHILLFFVGIYYLQLPAIIEHAMSAETDVKTDDSCVVEYIEIVPLVGRNDARDYDKIKQELLQDIKQEPGEPQEVSDNKDTYAAADVR